MEPTLKSLRYFMAVMESGSVTKAAAQLHIVPSAIHAAVNQVEEAFGEQLTIRQRSKGMAPTEAGRLVMTRIQHLLDEYDSLISANTNEQSQLVGRLKVGYYAPIAPAFLPQVIKQLVDDNPRVDFRLVECDNQSAQAGLVTGAFDVIICVGESLKPEITCATLIEVPAYVLVPENHALALKGSVSLQELHQQDLVLLDLPVVSEYYGRLFDQAGIKPRIAGTATSIEMVRSLVGAGLGCSILHMRPASDLTYAGDYIKAIPLYPSCDTLKIVLGHRQRQPGRLVKVFMQALQDYFYSEACQKLIVKL